MVEYECKICLKNEFNISASNINLDINFPISHNSKTAIDKIRAIPCKTSNNEQKCVNNMIIEHELYREHGPLTPLILLKTNLRKTPIKMMIDTAPGS